MGINLFLERTVLLEEPQGPISAGCGEHVDNSLSSGGEPSDIGDGALEVGGALESRVRKRLG